MKKCDDLKCRFNTMSHEKLKRYGNVCLYYKDKCISATFEDMEIKLSQNVKCILHNAIADVNYQPSQLTDQELEYCLNNEKRKGGQAKLQREKKRREKQNDNLNTGGEENE